MSTIGRTGKPSKTSKRHRAPKEAWEWAKEERHDLTSEKLAALVKCLIELDGLVDQVPPAAGLTLLMLAEGALTGITAMTATLKAIIPASDEPSEHPEQPAPASSPAEQPE